MRWYPPSDTEDYAGGSKRTDETKIDEILNKLFTNNENYQGLFPVYGDHF